MKNFLPGEYKKNEKLKINHSYLVEQFADYTKVFKEIEKVVKKGDYTLGKEVDLVTTATPIFPSLKKG